MSCRKHNIETDKRTCQSGQIWYEAAIFRRKGIIVTKKERAVLFCCFLLSILTANILQQPNERIIVETSKTEKRKRETITAKEPIKSVAKSFSQLSISQPSSKKIKGQKHNIGSSMKQNNNYLGMTYRFAFYVIVSVVYDLKLSVDGPNT